MTRFIYKGFYYPVIGERSIWINGTHEMILSHRFGGWLNSSKWWSFSWGIKVRLFNRRKPYFQFVVDRIHEHPLLELRKEYFAVSPEEGKGFLWSVYAKNIKDGHDHLYIGNIARGYSLSNLTDFRSLEDGRVACCGYDAATQTAYGWSHKAKAGFKWSHKAKAGFKIGDKIYKEGYNDPYALPQDHGYLECKTYEDQMTAALNYARSVS